MDCNAQEPKTTLEPTTSELTTSEPTSEPMSSSYTFDLNLIDYFVEDYGQMNDARFPITEFMANEGETVRISGSCYPEYNFQIDVQDFGCAQFAKLGCRSFDLYTAIFYAVPKDDGTWVTFRHCPECGCQEPGPENFHQVVADQQSGNKKPSDNTDLLELLTNFE